MKLIKNILAVGAASLVCISLAATIPVLAEAPSITGVEITPNPTYTDTDLTAVPSGWTDTEGDPEGYQWQWQIWDEGTTTWLDITGADTDTLANSNFNTGDEIKVICTPFDGAESGTAMENTIIISGGIVTITPYPAYIDTDLTATPEHWVKPGETEPVFSYQWQSWDGSIWVDIDGETAGSLSSTGFAVGDQYRVVCTPDAGDPVYTDGTIMGGTVEITPDPAYTDTDLTAATGHWPTPAEGALTFGYQWYKWDGAAFAEITGETGATLASTYFIKGDQLRVACTPSIDEVAGTPVEDEITISNRPPAITGVTISPDQPTTASLLEATPAGWSDADSDPEGYQWQWQKWDGIEWLDIDGAATNTLDNANFTLGDAVKVICTPFDGIDTSEPVEAEISIDILSYDTGIDVKPGSEDNPINLTSKGVIPVAIYTTEGFDAAGVDVASVKFGPAEASPVHSALEDVDGDGDLDLILHFRTQQTGIAAEDTSVTLTGEITGGTAFTGTDSIKIVPSKAQEAVQGNDEAPGAENGNEEAPGKNKEPGQPAEGKGKAAAPGLNKEPSEPAAGKGKNK